MALAILTREFHDNPVRARPQTSQTPLQLSDLPLLVMLPAEGTLETLSMLSTKVAWN
jgi:hypothetical protein